MFDNKLLNICNEVIFLLLTHHTLVRNAIKVDYKLILLNILKFTVHNAQ